MTVAAHYRGVNQRRLVPVVLERETSNYVSYRRGDRVFWTSRKVRIPRGETVLTDGVQLVRARCGNRLSETAQKPVDPAAEPTEQDLEQITDGTPALQPEATAPLTSHHYSQEPPPSRDVSPVMPKNSGYYPPWRDDPTWLGATDIGSGYGPPPTGKKDPILPPDPPSEWPITVRPVMPPMVDPTITIVPVYLIRTIPNQPPEPTVPSLPEARPLPLTPSTGPIAPDVPATPNPGPKPQPEQGPDPVPLPSDETGENPYIPRIAVVDESVVPDKPEGAGEVPEPGTLLLVGLALAVAVALRRTGADY